MRSRDSRKARASGLTAASLAKIRSPEMALRIEKAFGSKMDTLLRMQTAYEIAEMRKREAQTRVA